MALSAADIEALGYSHPHQVPGVGWCAIYQLVYTTAIVCGIGEYCYARRFCYASRADAIHALETWTGDGDPPGLWIKEKPGDRSGPGAVGDVVDRADNWRVVAGQIRQG